MPCSQTGILGCSSFRACMIFAERHSHWYNLRWSWPLLSFLSCKRAGLQIGDFLLLLQWSPFSFLFEEYLLKDFRINISKATKIAIDWSRQLCNRAPQGAASNRVDKCICKREQPQVWMQADWLFNADCQVWQLWNDNVEWRLVCCAQYYSESEQTSARQSDRIRLPWKARLVVSDVWSLVWIW